MTQALRTLLLAGLCLLALFLAGCGRKVELMAAMPEAEANEVLAALQNAGIAADKVPGKEGNVGVTVEGDQVGRAVDLLREKGLPRERFAGMGAVFKKEGLISSPLEERARYLFALSQELGATLSQIDGVVVARVHVVLPERSPTGEPGVPSSAAVFIKHQEGYNIEALQPLVRRLVTNSIPGLTPEKVTLVLVAAQPQAGGGAASAPEPGASRAAGPPKPAGQSAAAAPGGPVGGALVTTLALLLLGSLAASGFLAWRYWLPQRRQAPPSGTAGEVA